jgi:hypothetical protein
MDVVVGAVGARIVDQGRGVRDQRDEGAALLRRETVRAKGSTVVEPIAVWQWLAGQVRRCLEENK